MTKIYNDLKIQKNLANNKLIFNTPDDKWILRLETLIRNELKKTFKKYYILTLEFF